MVDGNAQPPDQHATRGAKVRGMHTHCSLAAPLLLTHTETCSTAMISLESLSQASFPSFNEAFATFSGGTRLFAVYSAEVS